MSRRSSTTVQQVRIFSRYRLLLCWGVLLIILAGCSSGSVNPKKALPSPETGKAVLTGQVLDLSGVPLKGITVRLAEVYRESQDSEDGAFVLDTAFSPGAVADENGFFVIQNIIPGEYVLVVGDVENNNYIIIAQEDGRPRVWKVVSDQTLDVGTLRIQYPAQQ